MCIVTAYSFASQNYHFALNNPRQLSLGRCQHMAQVTWRHFPDPGSVSVSKILGLFHIATVVAFGTVADRPV